MLDQKGICGSSGSACTSGSLDPSHVLLAIGLPHEIAHGSLRLTLSESNTKEEIDKVIDDLKVIVDRLRNMSPLYEDFVKKQKRKLLVTKKELARIASQLDKPWITAIALEVLISDRGFIKVKIWLGRLKKKIEKKQILKERSQEKEMRKDAKMYR